MSLKGRGQGVDLGTSTLSFMRSIIFSFFGRALPYDPLNLFPFFVFLSPRPHNWGGAAALSAFMNHRAATLHRCITLTPLEAILPPLNPHWFSNDNTCNGMPNHVGRATFQYSMGLTQLRPH